MVLSLTPAAVLAVMNRGITSSIVELELVFTMRFLAIMGHPASFKNGRGGRVSDGKLRILGDPRRSFAFWLRQNEGRNQ
jgi:hypothetical protein